MVKKEIKDGGVYYAKVSGKVVPLRTKTEASKARVTAMVAERQAQEERNIACRDYRLRLTPIFESMCRTLGAESARNLVLLTASKALKEFELKQKIRGFEGQEF